MTRQTRAKLPFEDLENLFAFAQRPEQNGDRADVERVRCEPQQVRRDAIEFGKNGAQVVCSRFRREHTTCAPFLPNSIASRRTCCGSQRTRSTSARSPFCSGRCANAKRF